eukprot:m.391278 g.391278  ORF g.391278 m.391278 type:complete len:772 (-) comp20080_c0_seq16:573-2888(-)
MVMRGLLHLHGNVPWLPLQIPNSSRVSVDLVHRGPLQSSGALAVGSISGTVAAACHGVVSRSPKLFACWQRGGTAPFLLERPSLLVATGSCLPRRHISTTTGSKDKVSGCHVRRRGQWQREAVAHLRRSQGHVMPHVDGLCATPAASSHTNLMIQEEEDEVKYKPAKFLKSNRAELHCDCLLDSVQLFALVSVLKLATSQHGVDDPADNLLVIVLLDKVLDEALLKRGPANTEAFLDGLLCLEEFLHAKLGTVDANLARLRGVDRRHLEEADGFLHVVLGHKWDRLHLCQRLGDAHEGFELADGDRDGTASLHLLFKLARVTANLHKVVAELFHCLLGKARSTVQAAVVNKALEQLNVDFTLGNLTVDRVQMNSHDVPGKFLIPLFVVFVLDDEDEIETREDGTLKLNVLIGGLGVVPATKHRVGGSKYRGPRVERGGNSGLSNGNGLLFHGFVNRHAVSLSHLVEFVNANHTTIGKHHCTAFEIKLARRSVANDRRSETCCTAAFAGRVNPHWSDALRKLEQLALGCAGITEKQHVDVTTQACRIRQHFCRATKQQARESLFDVFGSKNRRGNALADALVNVGLAEELCKLLFLLFGKRALRTPSALGISLHAHDTKVRVAGANSGDATLLFGGKDGENANDGAAGARHGTICEVAIRCQQQVPGHLSRRDHLGCFLKLERLLVDTGALVGDNIVRVKGAFLLPLGRLSGACARQLGATKAGLDRPLADGAALAALQSQMRRLGLDCGGTHNNARNLDQLAHVLRTKVAK